MIVKKTEIISNEKNRKVWKEGTFKVLVVNPSYPSFVCGSSKIYILALGIKQNDEINIWPKTNSESRYRIGVPKHISKLLVGRGYGVI